MVTGALYCDGYDVQVDNVQGVKFQKFCMGLCTRGLGNRPGRDAVKEDECINLEFGLLGVYIYGKTSKTA